ncbi:MAG: hypothetical protein DRP65_00495 [Planctomycetota bacterium]|nr:MAG: hypothetical protein DRP65_00495 [Planctomycetota bacterium]
MKTQCPHCENIHTVPGDYAGGKMKCEVCGERFVVARFKNSISKKILRPEIIISLIIAGALIALTALIACKPKTFAMIGIACAYVIVPLLIVLVASAFLRWFLGIQDIIDLLKIIAENTRSKNKS